MALSPILSGGQIIGISTICRDIRARLAIEREIRQAHEAEQRLREKLEHISRTALEVTDAVADLPRSDLRAVVQRIVTQAQAVTGAEYAALGSATIPSAPSIPGSRAASRPIRPAAARPGPSACSAPWPAASARSASGTSASTRSSAGSRRVTPK